MDLWRNDDSFHWLAADSVPNQQAEACSMRLAQQVPVMSGVPAIRLGTDRANGELAPRL